MNNTYDLKQLPPEINEQMNTAIAAFTDITKIPVTFFDNEGNIKIEYGEGAKICNHFDIYRNVSSPCRKTILNAIHTVSKLGEPYFFACEIGLLKIAMPLIINMEYRGCFIAGPIILERLSQRIIKRMVSYNHIQNNAQPFVDIITNIDKLRCLTTGETSSLGNLLNCTVTANIDDLSGYKKAINRYNESIKNNEYVQAIKNSNKTRSYPAEAEQQLLSAIAAGSLREANRLMKDYIDGILIYELGDLDTIKIHLIKICALVSISYMDRHDTLDITASKEFNYIHALNKIESVDQLMEWASNFIRYALLSPVEEQYANVSDTIKQSMHIISESQNYKITMTDVADKLHINPSYFSSLFKKETGETFTQYLTNEKIKKSKILLADTDMRLIAVAEHCGFDGQSYFTKIFKNIVGLSPLVYRQQQRNTR